MACTEAMMKIAEEIKPQDCCLVPESRAELTTEGGLDVIANFDHIKASCQRLAAAGVRVSIFIDADPRQLDAAAKLGAPVVELHTGAYADAQGAEQSRELQRLQKAAAHAAGLGLIVNAGHGLHYHNVQAIAVIPQIVELNIGHAIVARALLDGMAGAVREMKRLMVEARGQI
jgi:pyridoxine 5-phosphate synthase